MPLNVYLRQGCATPNDVILRDPTASPQTVVSVGQPYETDVAWAIGKVKYVSVGQAVESDLCQTIGRKKTQPLGQSSETDLAQSVTQKTVITVIVHQATESDSAQAFGAKKCKPCAQVLETDSVQSFGKGKTKCISDASETDVAGRTIVRTKVAKLNVKPIVLDAEFSGFEIESLKKLIAEKSDTIQIEITKGLVAEEETYQYEV